MRYYPMYTFPRERLQPHMLELTEGLWFSLPDGSAWPHHVNDATVRLAWNSNRSTVKVAEPAGVTLERLMADPDARLDHESRTITLTVHRHRQAITYAQIWREWANNLPEAEQAGFLEQLEAAGVDYSAMRQAAEPFATIVALPDFSRWR